MESIALAAAVITLGSLGVAAAAVVCTLLRLQVAALVLGIASALIGVLWLFTMPGVPMVGAINAVAGYWAVTRPVR